MGNCSVADLRQLLRGQGLSDLAAEGFVARWTEQQLSGHLRVWNHTWVPYCHDNGIDPWAYDTTAACNCLALVQRKSAQAARAAGKKVQHAVFKNTRAGIGAIWFFRHRDKPMLAADGMVASTAVGLRRTAPLQARYDEAWDPNIVFGYIYAMAVRDELIVDMPHRQQRPWVITLLRLRTAARAADVCPNKFGRGGIHTNLSPNSDPDVRIGIRGSAAAGTITHVRFWMNKTATNRNGKFSKWHDLGGYVRGTEQHPLLPCICMRRNLESYWANVRGLRRHSDHLFVAGQPRGDGMVYKISSETASHDTKKIMELTGVPSHFLSHSTRHACISRAARSGALMDDISRHVDVTKKVIDLFYDRPCDLVAVDEQLKLALTRLALLDVATTSAPRPAPTPSLEVVDGTADDENDNSDDDVGAGAYEVDKITAHRQRWASTSNRSACIEYRIRWKGFSAAHDSWEPIEHLAGAAAVVDEYQARHSDDAHLFALAERLSRRDDSRARASGVLAISDGSPSPPPAKRGRRR
jgi:hypothetical protein